MVRVSPSDTLYTQTECFDGTALFHLPHLGRTSQIPALRTRSSKGAGSAQYPNTPDGLQEFLSELRVAAKSGEQARVDSMIKQTEIPEYRNWFCSLYIPGSRLSWAIPYGKNLAQNEQAFKALWERLAQDDGEIQVRESVGTRTRAPVDYYHATWKSKTGATDEWIGEFHYIDGMFRWNSSVHGAVLHASPAPKRRRFLFRRRIGQSRMLLHPYALVDSEKVKEKRMLVISPTESLQAVS
jgi:hypothetical protein